MATDLPKAPKPYRSVKGVTRQNKQPYLVRMIDERSREGSLGGGGEVFGELLHVTSPTPSLAWYLPNNFEAEWNGLRVAFRVERYTEGKRFRWAIASFTVQPLKGSKPLGKIDHVPLSTFLEQAINLAAVQCITYPPGYEGAMLDPTGKQLPGWQGWHLAVPADRKEGEQYPVGWLNETPRDILREFIASATDSSERKKLNNAERLKVVAKAYNGAPERGKAAAVKKALEAVGDHVGADRRKQLVREAREAGLIPSNTRSKK